MSILTPEERAVLEAATARVEQKRAVAQHEKLRRSGHRPDVPFHVWREAQGAAAAGRQTQLQLLTTVFMPAGVTRQTRLEAAREAVAALPLQLEQLAQGNTAKRFRRKGGMALSDVARAVRDALESGRTGPHAQRGSPRSYVQQEDLDDLVPDGWGRLFALDSARLGRRAGVPPLAVPLLCLLNWCSSLADGDGRGSGAGLQASIDWLALKLGCSDTWVKHLLNRLDPFAHHRRELAAVRQENGRRRRRGEDVLPEPKRPTGTPYVHRFRRLALYATARKRDGSRGAAWVDTKGRPRFWFDMRGVTYLTPAGRGLLVRRARRDERPRPGRVPELRPVGAFDNLVRRAAALRWLRWRLRSRLAGAVESLWGTGTTGGGAPAECAPAG